MNQINTLHCNEPTEPPRYLNSQPLSVHIKYGTSTPFKIPMFLANMARLNNHVVDNGDVYLYPSEYPFISTSESVPYPDTTPIKSIDGDEMDQLLEIFHSDHDDGFLDVDHQMLQDLLVVAPS